MEKVRLHTSLSKALNLNQTGLLPHQSRKGLFKENIMKEISQLIAEFEHAVQSGLVTPAHMANIINEFSHAIAGFSPEVWKWMPIDLGDVSADLYKAIKVSK